MQYLKNNNNMSEVNRLVLIGNGFDLAHGLKTSYKDFLDWYMSVAFNRFLNDRSYTDLLIELKNKFTGYTIINELKPTTFEEVLNQMTPTNNYRSITHKSNFFLALLNSFKRGNWVDIERYYFKLLKNDFSSPNVNNKKEVITKLNSEFDFLIIQLAKYIETVNETINKLPDFRITSQSKLSDVFAESNKNSRVKFLNFNYTETLFLKHYAEEEDIIHIHGRVSDIHRNPIIFGYGDESDPDYQKIEDSGENMYLAHIKSFGYFRTNNYHQLLSYIDSAPYIIYIVGHSCGLSDRVLLNQIFEHKNCEKIEIFYYVRDDGTDNFTEITQEISRHFKPHNKELMRRRVSDINNKNIIPQNKID